jgi:hypothetical protein
MATSTFEPAQLSTTWLRGTLRRREFVLGGVAFVLSLAFARLVLAVDLLAVALLAVVVILVAICTKPRYGLYFLFAVTMMFDTGGTGADPLMIPGRYLQFSLQTTFHLNGAILIPFEMILLLTSSVWLAQSAMRNKMEFRGGALGRPMLLFTLLLVFAVVRGLVAGANSNYSLWESRFLFSIPLAYLVAVNTIRSRGHVRVLMTLILVCVSFSAIEAVWRKYALINNGLLGDAQETWYTHESVVIWGLLVTLALSQLVFGAPRWQKWLSPAMALVAMLAMLVSERRAGLIAVMVAVAILVLSLAKINKKAFLWIAIPTVLVGAIYLPLFWNSTSTLGQAARSVRSITGSADPRDAASNAWRDLEAINVRATIASDPVLGIGFGRPFLQVVTVPDISFFEFWNYESHHDLLWVWMKTGAFGFICFFVLMLGGIARGVWLAKTHPFPEFRVLAMVGVTAIVMSLIFSYVDLGLTNSRIPMLLGVMLGAMSALDRIEA